MGEYAYLINYSAVGDLIVVAMCIVMAVLVATSYISFTRNFLIFLNMIVYLALAALCNVYLHYHYLHISDGNYTSIGILRVIFHALIFSLFLLFVVYMVSMINLPSENRRKIMIPTTSIYIIVVVTDIITAIKGIVSLEANIFMLGYIAFLILILLLTIIYRNKVYSKAVKGLGGTMAVSFLILFIQGRHGQTSFTVATFLFPIISIMYLLHSNPYDIELGSLSASSVTETVRYNYRKKREFIFISLLLPEFDADDKQIPKELRNAIRKYSSEFYKKCALFRLTNAHMLLIADKKANPDHKDRMELMKIEFARTYEIYHYDYKYIVGESIEEISRKNEYIRFIKSIQRTMPINSIHVVDEKDIETFNRNEYILGQLDDIFRSGNLDDERVLAYCQPVYNIRKGIYDTAEALMRLRLPELGMVFPDVFIPLAEEYGYVHGLTRIILKKTCDEVKRLLDEGYEVKRVSVNISFLEVRGMDFLKDIKGIIENSGIPDGKIAIELTESQSDSDFELVRTMMDELKETGIKFYLDDFGTGFSNIERIMKLPFDIIKFDRSLLLACNADERSGKIVDRLANMFADLDYAVLYEGVENDKDEERCIRMKASYLQGYKYSKPIPIDELRNFFTRKEKGDR